MSLVNIQTLSQLGFPKRNLFLSIVFKIFLKINGYLFDVNTLKFENYLQTLYRNSHYGFNVFRMFYKKEQISQPQLARHEYVLQYYI